MDSLTALALGTAIAVILTGTGRLILRLLRFEATRPELTAALSLATGAGAYSYLFFALGHAGIIHTGLYWGVFAAGLVGAVAGGRFILRDFRGVRWDLPVRRPKWLFWWFAAAILVCVSMALISATAPVSDYDSKEYHVGLVKRYFHDGGIRFYFDSVAMSFYVGQTMLNLWVMKLGPDSACQVLTWWCCAGLLGAVYAIGRTLFCNRAALSATALVAAWPLFAERSIQPSPDLTSALFAVLFVAILADQRERLTPVGVALAGAMAGLAVAFRMNNMLYLPAASVFGLAWWFGECRLTLRRGVVLGAVATAFCVLFFLPWAVRNYLWTSNPVYPFMSQIFPGPMWNAQCGNLWHTNPAYNNFWSWLTHWPLKPLQFVRYGSLTLALVPLALIFADHRRASLILLVPVVVGIATVAYFSPDDRYFVAVLPLGAVLGGYALARLLDWGGWFSRLLAVLAALLLLGDLAMAGLWHQQFIRATVGLTPREEFIRNSSSYYDDFVWMNKNLPPDAKILMFYLEEYRLERPTIRFRDKLTAHIELFDLEQYADAGQLARALHKAGVTHFFFPDPKAEATHLNWSKEALTAKGIHLFTDLYEKHGVLAHHNPKSLIAGRLYSRTYVGTYLYRLIPPEAEPSHQSRSGKTAGP